MSGGPTVSDLRREVATTLAAISDTAALDARMIVAHALGCTPAEVILRDEEVVGGLAVMRARNAARLRAAGAPVARIVGEKEFYGLRLALSPDTLVPRADTETLVDAVLEVVPREAALAILDLGTGSGAILLALLSQLPEASGLGVDRAPGAVATAASNAAALGLAGRAEFAVGDWARGIEVTFDVVVANPPYIRRGEIAALPVEVRDHDPHLALDGGEDGFDAIRVILSDLDRVLAEGGAAFVEVGFDQAAQMPPIAAGYGFATTLRRDLAGIDRVAILSRQTGGNAASG